MFYEVIVPNPKTPEYDLTYQVEARNWRTALATALREAGTSDALPEGMTVRTDGVSYAVTDPATRTVYHLHHIEATTSRASTVLRAVTGSMPAVTDAPPSRPVKAAAAPSAEKDATGGRATESAKPRDTDTVVSDPIAKPAPAGKDAPRKPTAAIKLKGSGLGYKDRNTGEIRAIGAAPRQEEPPAEDTGRVVTQGRRRSGAFDIRRMQDAAQTPDARGFSWTAEHVAANEALEDVFLESQAIFTSGYEMEDAIDFIVDLAERSVESECGGLLFAADDGSHLYTASAFGTREDALFEMKLPLDRGLPALCLRESVSLNVVDPSTDPRNSPELQDAVQLEEHKSLCAAPVCAGPRTYGVLLMLNGKRGEFLDVEANILAYLGQQLGQFIEDKLLAGPL